MLKELDCMYRKMASEQVLVWLENIIAVVLGGMSGSLYDAFFGNKSKKLVEKFEWKQ